jgi:hypothetical protein
LIFVLARRHKRDVFYAYDLRGLMTGNSAITVPVY